MSTVEIPSGRSAAGCAGCGEVFTCVSAFDHHQTLRPESDGGGVICHTPPTRGLTLYERELKGEIWSLWGWPPSTTGRWYEAAG
jgi:hypothetical protein